MLSSGIAAAVGAIVAVAHGFAHGFALAAPIGTLIRMAVGAAVGPALRSAVIVVRAGAGTPLTLAVLGPTIAASGAILRGVHRSPVATLAFARSFPRGLAAATGFHRRSLPFTAEAGAATEGLTGTLSAIAAWGVVAPHASAASVVHLPHAGSPVGASVGAGRTSRPASFLHAALAFAIPAAIGLLARVLAASALDGIASFGHPLSRDRLEPLRHRAEERIADLFEGRARFDLLTDVLAEAILQVLRHAGPLTPGSIALAAPRLRGILAKGGTVRAASIVARLRHRDTGHDRSAQQGAECRADPPTSSNSSRHGTSPNADRPTRHTATRVARRACRRLRTGRGTGERTRHRVRAMRRLDDQPATRLAAIARMARRTMS